ncbi:MAG: hypothetical protein V3V95_00200 [Thermodesulfobacteriota bacterium]
MRIDPEEELLKAIELNDAGRYLEARKIFVANEGLLDTPLLISHFALSKAGAGGGGGEVGDFDSAQALCLKALKKDLENPGIYHNLAKIYLLEGKKELAVKAIEKGLKFDPAHIGLIREQKDIGKRRTPAIGFLSRGGAINKSIGKLTYKEGKPSSDSDSSGDNNSDSEE